ncbi:uncharacterized protein LOC123398431 [Hordeum vulgare subsp. vulgare]|uniref:uncharacterized protein LOC123398431 n=1 Tax=Hordeum vulgare subsp. vulgare TaxID=112509 RepID=UPI001D1A4761|nr:uncharacterized protein LOC123398431 [Hordeum vulgare subsp. vulgare]
MEDDAQIKSIHHELSQGDRCRVCKHEIAVCRDAQGPPCHVGIPITRLYRSKMFVSCAIRHIFEEDIHRIEPDVMQGDINSWTAYFFTFERLQYEVTFQYDDLATKIVGEGWQQLLDDYVVCPGDMMYIYMSNGGYNLSVDIKRDGVQQIPLSYVGMLFHFVLSCFYTTIFNMVFLVLSCVNLNSIYIWPERDYLMRTFFCFFHSILSLKLAERPKDTTNIKALAIHL